MDYKVHNGWYVDAQMSSLHVNHIMLILEDMEDEKPESLFELNPRNKQFILHCAHEIDPSGELNSFQ